MNRVVKIFLIGVLVPNLLFAERFTKNGEIIYDSKTKLSWQSRSTTKQFSWRNAIKYCKDLSYGGYSDWRLPNIDELKSLVDYSKYSPAIATTLIDIKTDDWYWSSSKYVKNSSYSWGVNFRNGNDCWGSKSHENYVLCAR